VSYLECILGGHLIPKPQQAEAGAEATNEEEEMSKQIANIRTRF